MALTWREEQLIAEQTIVYFKQDLKGALTASSWQLLQSLVVSLPERMPKWQAFPQLCEFLDPAYCFVLPQHQMAFLLIVRRVLNQAIIDFDTVESRERALMSFEDQRRVVVNRQPPPIGDPSHVDVHLSNPDVLLPHSVADFRHLDDFRRLTSGGLMDVLVLLQYQEAKSVIMSHFAVSEERHRWLTSGDDVATFLLAMPGQQSRIWSQLFKKPEPVMPGCIQNGMDIRALINAYPRGYSRIVKYVLSGKRILPFIREVTDFAAVNSVLKPEDRLRWVKRIVNDSRHLQATSRARLISHAAQGMPEQKALLWAECAIEPTKGAINNINVLINFMTGFAVDPYVDQWYDWITQKGGLGSWVRRLSDLVRLEGVFPIEQERFGRYWLKKKRARLRSLQDLVLFYRWYPGLHVALKEWVLCHHKVYRWIEHLEDFELVYSNMPELRPFWMQWLLTSPYRLIKQPADLLQLKHSIGAKQADRLFDRMMQMDQLKQMVKHRHLQVMHDLYRLYPERAPIFDRLDWFQFEVSKAIKYAADDLAFVMNRYPLLHRLVWQAVNMSWKYFTNSQSFLMVLHQMFPSKKMTLPKLSQSPDSIQYLDVEEGKSSVPSLSI